MISLLEGGVVCRGGKRCPNEVDGTSSSLGPSPAQKSPPSALVNDVQASFSLVQISPTLLPIARISLPRLPTISQPAPDLAPCAPRLRMERPRLARAPLIPLSGDEGDRQLGHVVLLEGQQQRRGRERVVRLRCLDQPCLSVKWERLTWRGVRGRSREDGFEFEEDGELAIWQRVKGEALGKGVSGACSWGTPSSRRSSMREEGEVEDGGDLCPAEHCAWPWLYMLSVQGAEVYACWCSPLCPADATFCSRRPPTLLLYSKISDSSPYQL